MDGGFSSSSASKDHWASHLCRGLPAPHRLHGGGQTSTCALGSVSPGLTLSLPLLPPPPSRPHFLIFGGLKDRQTAFFLI